MGLHKTNMVLFFFLDPSKCICQSKKTRFSLNNNVITVGLGRMYRWILSSFLRIKVQYWPPPSLRSGGQPVLHLNSSEWRQYSPIHPPQTYRIPSMLCYDNIKRNSFSIFGPWDTHRVKMRINGDHSKLLQSSENYEFQLSKKIAIQSQRRLMKVAPDKMKKSKMERCHKKAIRVSLWCLLSTTTIFT